MKNLKNVISVTLFLFSINSLVYGQDADKEAPKDDAGSLAKELANPNATRGQLFNNFDYINYNGDVPDASQNAFVYSFQPSLPVPLAEGTNLFIRPLIPVYLSQPTIGDDGFSNQTSLGNISADVAIGKTWPSKWMTLVGVFASFPTATNKDLRSKQTTLGPEFVIGKVTSWGFLGIMVNHAWGLGSVDSELEANIWTISSTGRSPRASVTAGQYFYTINVGDGWQIQGQPTFAYNHNAEEGNQFTFPLGTGVTHVTKWGKLPVKLNMQYWYYVASPDTFGPQHQVRLVITPIVKLPW